MNVSRRIVPTMMVAAILIAAASCIESKNPLSDKRPRKSMSG